VAKKAHLIKIVVDMVVKRDMIKSSTEQTGENKMQVINAYHAAEIIQGRFRFDDDDNVIDCPDRYMSDILGSDWGPEGQHFDNYTPLDVFYRAVRQAAQRKYGPLPF
jgi:hypothetical protein